MSPLPGARAVLSLPAAGLARDELVAHLSLAVLLAPLRGPGRDAVPNEGAVLSVDALRARGFAVDPAQFSLPQPLGAPNRDGASFVFPVQIVGGDCSVSRFEPRRVDVVLRRGTSDPVAIPAELGAGVAQALDQVAGRTCRRRPAGPAQ